MRELPLGPEELSFVAGLRAQGGPNPFLGGTVEGLLALDGVLRRRNVTIERTLILDSLGNKAGYTELRWGKSCGLIVHLLPEFRGCGWGRELLPRLWERGVSRSPQVTEVSAYSSDDEGALAFFRNHGFSREEFLFESRLSLADVSAEKEETFRKAHDFHGSLGVKFLSLAKAWEREGFLDSLHSAYKNIKESLTDLVPLLEKDKLRAALEECCSETSTVAMRNGRVLGLYFTMKIGPALHHAWLSGVVAEERRQGIAFALRHAVLAKAKERGVKTLTGTSSVENVSIRHFLKACGYEFSPVFVLLRKTRDAS